VYNEAFGVESRVTVVIDRERIVRGVYAEPRDFESHPVHALEMLAAIGEDTSE
jgi:peroxiredoxin